jgi:imidazolonepropionase-like amidohydrolase/Tol biopolymer transport system component
MSGHIFARFSLALVGLLMLPVLPAAEDKNAHWDVSDPPGPSSSIDISTREGTWMSVDVSPDGNTIVFDLLGDIYAVPAAGGRAKALSSGMEWDMQPRFSPDGRHIAFISDRDGADNLWIMRADGSDPVQVSKEDFRLVHNPAWSPDGRFIAVRKHFTKRRSLGAGEIWFYYRDGGEGLQVIEKRTDQKDINEPAFSPDGRYLYYSLDATPGETYEYNKDSNGEIYQIRRLDRTTGEDRVFAGGAGGAIRPVPSPDGSSLAFVRRVRGKSVLFIKDIASGVETALFDALDRDNQEIWAIHGVYPNMAWLPDNQAILVWAGGKIRRVDVNTGSASTIEFEVDTSLEARKAVRFPVPVAPESFKPKMLRWVEMSPDGKRVVFSAMGHLYVKTLPDGVPERLTDQDEHFEYYPSFSRDGEQIVYVSWDDEELGSVRVIDAKGGRSNVVTAEPGHYVEPRFAPDGQSIVYRKLPGDPLRAPWWGEEPGIYEVSSRGGTADFLTREGERPRFGENRNQLYLIREGEDDTRMLVSRRLSSGEEHVVASSKFAADFVVSPDGAWLAVQERFHVYLLPVPGIGKTLEVEPEMKSVSAKRLTSDAGDYLHWSGDSRSLHWSLGPTLFSVGIDDAADADGNIAVTRTPLDFEQRLDVPTGKIAITGVRIITMNGDEIIEDGVIIIDGNKISAIGPRVGIKIPRDAETLLTGGMTVMPGIVDAHWHGPQGSAEIVPRQNWVNYATLAFGVTTIHDPSNDSSVIFTAKEMARAGLITAPRIFSTGTILYGASTEFTAQVDSLDDARATLRRMQALGAESVKSYNQPRRNQRQQILAAARELEINVFPEGGALFQHNMNMIVDGHSGIEHSLPLAKIYDDVTQLWSQTDVGYTPTLVVAYGGIEGENFWYQESDVFDHERVTTFVPRAILDPRGRRRMIAPEEEYNHIDVARVAARLAGAGVSVQVGAHGQREGLGAHWEMWMLAQGGMTPLEVIRAATINGARYLGMDGEIGSLEAGKLADLIILEANPLTDIRNTEKIKYVMVNGRLYDAATMNETGNHPRARQPFYWER